MSQRSKEEYNAYMRAYVAQRREERKRAAKAQLGGKCSKCSVMEKESGSPLEFDHIDPSTKVDILSNMWVHSEKIIQEELAKCQLLCRKCHGQKTIIDVGNQLAAHGTLTMHRHYKCRCQPCKDAYNAYNREWKRKKRLEKLGR